MRTKKIAGAPGILQGLLRLLLEGISVVRAWVRFVSEITF
jgi:hypothetical protein